MIDYEVSETSCPKCGHRETRYRNCINLHCEDGFIDESEDDPINFMPGEAFTECEDCHGTGIESWCPKCGADLSTLENRSEMSSDPNQED